MKETQVSSQGVYQGLTLISLQHISVCDESMAACWAVE